MPNSTESLKESELVYDVAFEPVYDILDAGPTHMFMVKTDKGPMLVHNCQLGLGYGAGWKVLQRMLRLRGGVALSDTEVQNIVQIYRNGYFNISNMWKQLSKVLINMLMGYAGEVGNKIKLKYYPDKIMLPSGRYLYYPDMQTDNGETTYQDFKGRRRLFGAKILENIIQAMARDIVMYQMCKVNQELQKMGGNTEDKVRQLVLSVHDEIVAIVPDEEVEQVRKIMEDAMRKAPSWAPDLPLNCESGAGKTYGDAK